MAKDRANRTRKNELKIYLSDNEKYILDRKVELSKRKSASDYIRTLILFGFVYDVDYSYLRQYNETLGKISGNLNHIAKRINSTGNVYEEDMAEVKAIMDEVWRTQKAMLKKAMVSTRLPNRDAWLVSTRLAPRPWRRIFRAAIGSSADWRAACWSSKPPPSPGR